MGSNTVNSDFELLIATFQAQTVSYVAAEVFETLGHLIAQLQHLSPPSIAQHIIPLERAVKDLCFSTHALSLPILDHFQRVVSLMYLHQDSRDMLKLVGDIQDGFKVGSFSSASLCALAGIATYRGKALSGHLLDTLKIVEQIASRTNPNHTMLLGCIRATLSGLLGAQSAGKLQWAQGLKILTRLATFSKSLPVSIRNLAIRALRDFASVHSTVADKVLVVLVGQLKTEPVAQLKQLIAQTIGSVLGSHRSEVIWTSPAVVVGGGVGVEKRKMDQLTQQSTLHDVLRILLAAYQAETGSMEMKSLYAHVVVSLFTAMPLVTSVEDVQCQAMWALQFTHHASFILREGLSTRQGERLQLALAQYLLTAMLKTEHDVEIEYEVCLLISTLGEASTCLLASLLPTLCNSGPSSSRRYYALLRTVCLNIPSALSPLVMFWVKQLEENLHDDKAVFLAVQALQIIVESCASMNRGGEVPTLHLFALSKALVSRLMHQGDATGEVLGSCGWALLSSLFSLGFPSFSSHLITLFPIWQETLSLDVLSDDTLAHAFSALISFLKHVEEGKEKEWFPQVAALLTARDFNISKRSLACQTLLMRLLIMLRGTTFMDTNVKPYISLSLFHVFTTEKFRSSMLEVGGLLMDEEVEEESEDVVFSAQEGVDVFLHHCSLHALVGQRTSTTRKTLSHRVKIAMQGKAYAEPSLAEPDPLFLIPFPQREVQLLDASIQCIAQSFLQGSSKWKLSLATSLQTKYASTPNFFNKEYNLACLLLCVSKLVSAAISNKDNEEEEEWKQMLATLAERLLVQHCTPAPRPLLDNKIVCACAETLRRLGSSHHPLGQRIESLRISMKEEELFALCSHYLPVDPVLALQSWIRFLSWGHFLVFPLKKSLGLLQHSLTLPHFDVSGMWVMKLCNAILLGANVELQPKEISLLLSTFVWTTSTSLDGPSDKKEDLQVACLLFANHMLYFHLAAPRVFSTFLLQVLNTGKSLSILHTGLSCFLRLCEVEATTTLAASAAATTATSVDSAAKEEEGEETAFQELPLVFDVLERVGRLAPRFSHVVLFPSRPVLLRKCWKHAEISGAIGRAYSSKRNAYIYPPEAEEDACRTLSEMIRITHHSRFPLLSQFLCSILTKNETRWQTKLVAVETLHWLLVQHPQQNALQLPLALLLNSVCQVSTLTVGESVVSTLQCRALACLHQLVSKFALLPDPAYPKFPLLRQFEAQLNATVKPGLQNTNNSELMFEASDLVPLLLLSNVSTSAKRLMFFLQQDQEKDEDDDVDEKPNVLLADDFSNLCFLVSRHTSFAKLVAGVHQNCTLQEVKDRVLDSCILESGKDTWPLVWSQIVRDFWVLSLGQLGKRHVDSLYQEEGSTLDLLLPLYRGAWLPCALALAYEGKSLDLVYSACMYGLSQLEDIHMVVDILSVMKRWDDVELLFGLLDRAHYFQRRGRVEQKDACVTCARLFLAQTKAMDLFDLKTWHTTLQLISSVFPQKDELTLILDFNLTRIAPFPVKELLLLRCAKEGRWALFDAIQSPLKRQVIVSLSDTLDGSVLFSLLSGMELNAGEVAIVSQRMKVHMGRVSESVLLALSTSSHIDVFFPVVWATRNEWIVHDAFFSLLCANVPVTPITMKSMLAYFLREESVQLREERRVGWRSYLTRLVSEHRQEFQLSLSLCSAEEKNLLRSFMTG